MFDIEDVFHYPANMRTPPLVAYRNKIGVFISWNIAPPRGRRLAIVDGVSEDTAAVKTMRILPVAESKRTGFRFLHDQRIVCVQHAVQCTDMDDDLFLELLLHASIELYKSRRKRRRE